MASPQPEQTVAVAILGYGIRLEVRAPFKAGRVPAGPNGAEDQFIVSQWDVTVAGSGADIAKGLRNVIVIPGEPQAKQTELRFTSENKNGESVSLYRLGETGTQVILGTGVESLAGIALEAGPADSGWSIEVNGRREFWPADRAVQSADSATGRPYKFTGQGERKRPYGPWPSNTARWRACVHASLCGA